MTLDSYISSLRGKRIAVIGLGVSNRPLLERLLEAGCAVTVRDRSRREDLGEAARDLEARGCRLRLGKGTWRSWRRISSSARRACILLPRSWRRPAGGGRS